MNGYDFAPIKQQALAWIDRVIAGLPVFAPISPIPDATSPTMPHVASPMPSRQSDTEAAVSGVIVNADTDAGVSANDDSMEWLSAHAPAHGVETLQALAREAVHTSGDDNHFQGRGRVGVRPDHDVIERLLASYSKQRQAVWWWCVDNASIITHDMPSARAVGKGAGVSYETARHVLTDWRNLYGLTLAPVNG